MRRSQENNVDSIVNYSEPKTHDDAEPENREGLHIFKRNNRLCRSGNNEGNDDDNSTDEADDISSEIVSKGTKECEAAASDDCQVISSIEERCCTIRDLIEEQHRKWLSQHSQTSASNDVGWWATTDAYNITAFNQVNGIWPLGHPLPLPDWLPDHSEHNKGVLSFDSVWQYEDLNAVIETKVHRLLDETHYNTVHLFVEFYKAFKRTRRSDLKSFFQFYDIPINRRHHMCVSLAMEIMTRLIDIFPVLEHYLYIVSCEEQVVSLGDYIESCEEMGLNSSTVNVEKEHAMVAMKISVAGREGVMILDPGYHVARAVTVMKDKMYPHTGWFTQSKEPHLQRAYCYNYCLHNNKYVEWKEREIRSDQSSISEKSSLVYIDQSYVTAIDVTVRRNLVYNFRSLLSRDTKGRVYAGIYFPLLANCHEAHLTLFYDGPNNQRVKVKFMFSTFKNQKIPENVHQHLKNLSLQLNMSLRELTDLCRSLADVVMDKDFISQILAINDDIGNMSAEN